MVNARHPRHESCLLRCTDRVVEDLIKTKMLPVASRNRRVAARIYRPRLAGRSGPDTKSCSPVDSPSRTLSAHPRARNRQARENRFGGLLNDGRIGLLLNLYTIFADMDSDSKRRHVFISHHHADDGEVTKLTSLLAKSGHDVRNSSIRAKPANQRRLDQGLVKDETIRRLLRMKITWAGTVVVLIGKDTHSRPWVNWEIEQANKQGKRIVGVYVQGGMEVAKPPALEKYASAIVGWNSDSIMAAIDGTDNPFQNPDGSSRTPAHAAVTLKC